jgi:Predicted AAA-ATPase
MTKKFNITGLCFADEHYMADVSEKLKSTLKMVNDGDYFIINRPRQYGKTTMLYTLEEMLEKTEQYLVFNISFEGIGDAIFEDEGLFASGFFGLLARRTQKKQPVIFKWMNDILPTIKNLYDLSMAITDLAEKTQKKLVVLIDEVDKSSNNQLFVSFLAMLRHKYLDRRSEKTFHSVVLAGLHDVKSLKLKIRADEEQKNSSPWNIAADFKVNMNLLPHEIKPMLDDYVGKNGVKMDTKAMADGLFYYTSGYPFLVSKLCKILDEDILPTKEVKELTNQDLEQSVRKLVTESNTNFESLIKNLENNPKLYDLVYDVAVEGLSIDYNFNEPDNNLGVLHGIFSENKRLSIHNRIYSEVIVNYMTAKMSRIQMAKGADFGSGYVNSDKKLNMELALLKFQAFMKEQYSKQDRDFLERNGRLVFLAFMKPILNGHGYDFKETQISEERRLDVTMTFYYHKYVAELKIWRGQVAHEEGLNQLNNYLNRLNLTEGYLIIFDHKEVKKWQSQWINHEGKKIFMVWV